MPRESIWLRPESAGVGRPAERNRAQITAAAIAVADAEGFAAVTMRRVAARLNTGAASLYRYVHNRGDLLELMIDEAYGEVQLCPTGQGWLADLVEVAREGMRVLIRHPWFVDAITEMPFAGGPNVARMTEYCLRVLADHPASGQRKMEAIAVMGSMVRQYSDFAARHGMPEMLAAQSAFFLHVAQDGHHPHLAAVLSDPAPPAEPEEPIDLLSRILGMVLDGMLGPAG